MHSYSIQPDFSKRLVTRTNWSLHQSIASLSVVYKSIGFYASLQTRNTVQIQVPLIFLLNPSSPSQRILITNLFHDVENFKSMNDSSKYGVQAIQMGLLCVCDKELATVGVWSTVGHG